MNKAKLVVKIIGYVALALSITLICAPLILAGYLFLGLSKLSLWGIAGTDYLKRVIYRKTIKPLMEKAEDLSVIV